MFAIYLKSGIDINDRGYLKGFKVQVKTIEGTSYRHNKPILLADKDGFRTYKRYTSALKYCEKLPELLKMFCSDGQRYGWKYRCLYDIFIVDLDTGASKQAYTAELREKLINEDVKLGLQGYY